VLETTGGREVQTDLSVKSLLRARQLCTERALDFSNNRVIWDGLARLVLVDDLRLHIQLLCELFLRESLCIPRLDDRLLQVGRDGRVCGTRSMR
jgi:hypothetical protein